MTSCGTDRLRFLGARLGSTLEIATGLLPRQSYVPKRPCETSLEEERTVDRVLAGDVSAYAFIVQRWQGPIVNLAYRFCRDRSRAEDMAQEVFLRAFRALPKWRREAAFSTWLFALATNLFRSEIRRHPPSSAIQQQYFEATSSSSLEDAAADEQRAEAVRRAVESLPSKYREAVILFYFHGKDVSEAARSLNVREGTLKARLSRARDILRTKLTRASASSESGARNAIR